MRLMVIGIPGSRRTQLLDAAVRGRADLALTVVPWLELIDGRAELRRMVEPADIVRIDSPGRCFETERALLRRGAASDSALLNRIDRLCEERGRVLWPAAWYAGLQETFARIREQLQELTPHMLMNDPDDIAIMFDKTGTHARLAARGVPVPPAIGRVESFDELMEQMSQRGWRRAFVKLAYGSSASGTIALRFEGTGTNSRARVQAFTTVELDGIDADGWPRMYNTRRIRRLDCWRDVAAVVDAICRHGAHAERWLPKAGIDGRSFDLRVLVIGGRACHTVVRLSRTPMTNLHLLNDRADATRVRERCGDDAWHGAMRSCEDAMAAFPRSLHGGVDLLVSPDFRRHAVLEVNAFGDLLPGSTWRGMDAYEAELAAVHDEPAMHEPRVDVVTSQEVA